MCSVHLYRRRESTYSTQYRVHLEDLVLVDGSGTQTGWFPIIKEGKEYLHRFYFVFSTRTRIIFECPEMKAPFTLGNVYDWYYVTGSLEARRGKPTLRRLRQNWDYPQFMVRDFMLIVEVQSYGTSIKSLPTTPGFEKQFEVGWKCVNSCVRRTNHEYNIIPLLIVKDCFQFVLGLL